MSDIVERLIGLYLGIHEVSPRYAEEVCKEAADVIEQQRAVIAKYAAQSKVVNCTIITEGDPDPPAFFADGDTGVITAHLDGYLIQYIGGDDD